MPRAIVVGGGLAGMAATLALESARFEVELFEARSWLGGRAGSFPLDPANPRSGLIDNCQHILLSCCVNLLDFYRRLGVADRIRFFDEYHFIEPGGRVSVLRPGSRPGATGFARAFSALPFLGLCDKLAVLGALALVRRDFARRKDLDAMTMQEWLRRKRQPRRALARFWRQILVSAVNEELDRMAARHGLQVFWLAFLAGGNGYRMGVPMVPLSELYAPARWRRFPRVNLHLFSPVRRFLIQGGQVQGILTDHGLQEADYYIAAVPFDRLRTLAPELGVDISALETSPITAIHLWFDRPVTELPQATLLDRTIQWMFNKSDGRYLLLVVSASRSLLGLEREKVIELALHELGEFLPRSREARLERAHVVKEARATLAALPGLEAQRPPAATRLPGLFLAGDWTRTGWPATMEGAVRSGYLAAEAVAAGAGAPQRFLIPDPAP